jgi:predicted RNase H-like nuclease
MTDRRVVGVDGARKGWVAIVLDPANNGITDTVSYDTIGSLLRDQAAAEVIAVDIPVCLGTTAPRAADQAAREFVGPRASSVFTAPLLDALESTTYAEAKALRGLSRQSFALFERIREVRQVMDDPRVFEIHPEVSFRQLKGAWLTSPKWTWGGFQERVALLRKNGLEPAADLPRVSGASVDDVLDASAAAWSAARIARGDASYLPENSGEGDPRIWF